MFIFIIVLAVVVQSLVALFVLQRDFKNRENRLFFGLYTFLTIWAVINFIITRDPHSSSQLILYRLLMASVVAQNTFFLLFSRVYKSKNIKSDLKFVRLYILLSILTFVVALSPLVFTSVKLGPSGARPIAGPGMILFIIHAVTSVVLGLRSIYRRLQESVGNNKKQLQLIFVGSIILWGVVPITNFIVSMATQTLFFARLSPIYTLIFSSVISYAIIAQRLFDIRAAVARSVAYVISLTLIIASYALVFFGVINVAFAGSGDKLTRQIIQMVLVAVLVLSFHRVKLFFDKFTNSLFFRDAYDTQAFIDNLNKVLVNNLELEPLLADASKIIADNLKSEWCVFGIKETSFRNRRVVGTVDKYFAPHEIKQVRQITPHLATNVVITDSLSDDQAELKQILAKNDIALLARLAPDNNKIQEGIGYLLLGQKKSGNPYSATDQHVVDIVARELLIAIQNSLRFEEIENFNTTLQEKVDKATHQLRRANERLKQLDETKDDFISMASHQLRTPLTSVKGYISMILEGDAGRVNATQRKMLSQSFTASQRMVYLISDLLNVSRLKTGKFAIDSTPINLAEVIDAELGQLEEAVKSKNLKLIYDKPKDFPTLLLDDMKIRQVIMNFVDNAIYYTPSGGKIEVKLDRKPQAIELRVIDTGIGVPANERHHLFTKFYRAKNAQKARPDGTGLGLFMAKKVIIAEGGSIIFDSKENKGSTFGFRLPLSKIEVKS